MFYISRIKLHNVRCFRETTIELNPYALKPSWTVIVGNNGVGKSTLLRSIALGLCDLSGAYTLLGDLYGEWLCEGEKDGYIELEFAKYGGSKKPKITTTFHRGESGYTLIEQNTIPEEDFPWDSIFVCGYGAARRTYGTKDYAEYTIPDAVYTLFNYDTPLQNAELILRRLESENVSIKDLLRRIDEILMLPLGSVRLNYMRKRGIFVKGPWGVKSLGALADGYQAMIALMVDILGWLLFYDPNMLKKDKPIRGIILLDEIEQHLHPRWQQRILGLLHNTFPHLQLITTTHSPMCTIGTTELEDKDCSLVLLTQEDGSVHAIDRQPPPRKKRADQVLTSYLFGLATASDSTIKRDIQRYSQLLEKRRSKEEERELIRIKRSLEDVFAGETALERETTRSIREIISKKPNLEKITATTISYETKRQLRELLKDYDLY
ncbi:MAG: AAA family ATPase [Candidatus Neomarinimicrobiota bacterium]